MMTTGGDIPSFKILLVGDGAVGKTTFIKMHAGASFEQKYFATMGVEVTPITLHTTTEGPIQFNVWDVAGQEKNRGMTGPYFLGAQAAIIMFDLTSPISYKNAATWYRDITRITDKIPIVLCGNKIGDRNRQVQNKDIVFHRTKGIQYYDLSCKSAYNMIKPFLYLATKLLGNVTLSFTQETLFALPPADPSSIMVPLFQDETSSNDTTKHENGDNTVSTAAAGGDPLVFNIAKLSFSSAEDNATIKKQPSNDTTSSNTTTFPSFGFNSSSSSAPAFSLFSNPSTSASSSPFRSFSTSSSLFGTPSLSSATTSPFSLPSNFGGISSSVPVPKASSTPTANNTANDIQQQLKERDTRIASLEKEVQDMKELIQKLTRKLGISIY